jgi:hypothetical protein
MFKKNLIFSYRKGGASAIHFGFGASKNPQQQTEAGMNYAFILCSKE